MHVLILKSTYVSLSSSTPWSIKSEDAYLIVLPFCRFLPNWKIYLFSFPWTLFFGPTYYIVLNLIDSFVDSSILFSHNKTLRESTKLVSRHTAAERLTCFQKPCPLPTPHYSYPPAIAVYKSVKGGEWIWSRGYIIFCTEWSKLQSGCMYVQMSESS